MRPTIQLTAADYAAFPPNGMQIQLADGELIMAPAPNHRHQRLVGKIFFLLETFVRQTKSGEILFSPFDIYLSETNVLQPDIAYFGPETLHHISQRGAEGAPTLVVEVLSPTTTDFDRNLKKSIFARFGVREMWIVDGESSSIEVHNLRTGDMRSLAAPNTLRTEIFPGLEIPVDEIFA